MAMKTVTIGNYECGNEHPLVLMAGPCALESLEHSVMLAQSIGEMARRHGVAFVFKGSFDKANRSSLDSPRGVGMEKGLEILTEVREQMGCPVMTDVHTEEQATRAGAVVDMIQIPAFLCRQTDLLVAAGKSGAVVNVKKGQFMAPWDMAQVAHKIASTGNDAILLTERGVSFGYQRLVSDLRAVPIMQQTGYPVIFDATHSVQQPSSLGKTSGGERSFIATLARAAVAVGCAGLFIEVHEEPERAPSDAATMLPLPKLDALLKDVSFIDAYIKKMVREPHE